ncbi:MAG: hypothetical protein JWQ62_610 [Lacunisphaera sp.]|nr:hypothetical protein [Lacunisphaera sp.]
MFRRMNRLLLLLGLALFARVSAADAPPAPLEKEVGAIIAGPQVTVVHFWAPWCPNCRAELDSLEGWAKFTAANPEVKVVFLNIWHKGQDPTSRLTGAGLGAQPNLVLFTHPNRSRLEADRLKSFLGLPITWIPTTWVYRAGQLRAAFNYGEIRFPVLQQMVDDARNEWQH